MTKLDAISMIAHYAAHTPADDHIRTMAPRMLGEDFGEKKAMRWLGWVQGVLVERGVFTLDEVKEHSRTRVVMPGPYMMTRSGRRFYFHNPDPSEILLSDIDFALRHLARFTGHVGLYNVATHSVNVLQCAIDLGGSLDTAQAALLHDAHEAFVGDISSPLKLAIGPAFERLDRLAARAVAVRFGLVEHDPIVHKADRMVTHAEALHFMGDAAAVWAVDPWIDFEPDRFQGRYAFENACDEWGIT